MNNNKICANCINWWGQSDSKYASCEHLGSDTDFDSFCDGFIPKSTSIIPSTSLKGKILPHKEADQIIQTLLNSGFTFTGADWGRDKTDEHSGGPYSTYENKTTNEIITVEPYSITETKFC